MNRPLVELLDGALLSASGRLAPEGTDMPGHFLLAARRLAECEGALYRLEVEPGPFESSDLRVRASTASFATVEAALAFWGLAVRLRSRFTGEHAKRASEPLRMGLMNLAASADEDAEIGMLLGEAARSLALVSPAVDAARHTEKAVTIGVAFDPVIQQFVAQGTMSLLRIALEVRESATPD